MKEQSTIQKQLTRVPQHMAMDIEAMRSQFDKQTGVIRDIFIFTVKRQFTTQNLFGQIVFSAEEFCREMGYNQNEMQRRLGIWNDKFKPPTLIDGHECDSMLEYALYRAGKENVEFTRWSKEGNPAIYFYQILDSLEIVYNKATKKKVKRYYYVTLSPKILDDIFVKYFVLDYEEYKSLAAKSSDATSSYRNFYIFFSKMIAVAKSNKCFTYKTNIDELSKVFSYEASEPRTLKQSVKRSLDAIQRKLKFPFSYKFTPSKDGSKISYNVLFIFTKELYDDFDEKLLRSFWFKIRERAFGSFKKLTTENIQGFQDASKRRAEIKTDSAEFHKWWYSDDDRDLKTKLINDLIQELFP